MLADASGPRTSRLGTGLRRETQLGGSYEDEASHLL